MKKIIISIIVVVIAAVAAVLGPKSCKGDTPVTIPDTITFESVVDSDYNYIQKTFADSSDEYTHFYEVRIYMPERIDSAAIHKAPIDSITSIFAVGQKVWFFNHKITNGVVTTDTCIYNGPFVEDCVMPWPLPVKFDQIMDTIASKELIAPNQDIVLRRALIWHPKTYPDFTIYAGDNNWWFISAEDGSIRTDQCSKEWLKQYGN